MYTHQSRLAKAKIPLLKPVVAAALFALEQIHQEKDTCVPDDEDSMVSPDLIQDVKDNFYYSNFESIVKPTPFQTFSNSSLLASRKSFPSTLSNLPPASIANLEPANASIQAGEPAAELKSSATLTSSTQTGVRSILKLGSKSRYSKEASLVI
jgi:hypothetical protein